MYKIIQITDKQGIPKSHYATLDHPQLLGEFENLNLLKGEITNGTQPCCCFIWEDNPDKMMRTSRVQSISEWDNKIKIVTMNSVYVFERVE